MTGIEAAASVMDRGFTGYATRGCGRPEFPVQYRVAV